MRNIERKVLEAEWSLTQPCSSKDDNGNHSIIYHIDIDAYYLYNIDEIYVGD